MVKRTTELPPWRDLAYRTLQSAIARDDLRTAELINQLGQQYGRHWPEILYTLIDAMLGAQGVGPEDYGSSRVTMKLQNVDTGAINETELLDSTAWTAAMVGARVSDDRAQYYALLNQISTDQQAAEYVSKLVQTVGITISQVLQGAIAGHVHGPACINPNPHAHGVHAEGTEGGQM